MSRRKFAPVRAYWKILQWIESYRFKRDSRPRTADRPARVDHFSEAMNALYQS